MRRASRPSILKGHYAARNALFSCVIRSPENQWPVKQSHQFFLLRRCLGSMETACDMICRLCRDNPAGKRCRVAGFTYGDNDGMWKVIAVGTNWNERVLRFVLSEYVDFCRTGETGISASEKDDVKNCSKDCFYEGVRGMNIVLVRQGKVELYNSNGSFVRIVCSGNNAVSADLSADESKVLVTTANGKVELLTSKGSFIRNITSTNAVDARWSGGDILVKTANGKTELLRESGSLIRTFA